MRLIDADALIEVLQNREIHAESFDKRIAIKGDRQVVINAPTIDAVQKHQFSEETSTLDTCPYYHHEPTGEPFCEMEDRRHGKWKDIDGDGHYWECSVCGEVLCCNNNFCPNCGAKMDKNETRTTIILNETTYTPTEAHSYSMSICDSCKYIHVPFTHYPCSNCYNYDKYVKWKD